VTRSCFIFHDGLVDDQPRADVADVLQRHQAVGLQRVAALDQVDDQVGQADQRGQFHGAVELDDLDLLALGGEVALGAFDVLGGDAQAPATPRHRRIGRRPGAGHHQPAAGDAQVERFVQPLAAMLQQHVLAGDAEVGGAVLHIGRHVAGADDDQLHARVVGVQDQLAAALGVVQRADAGGGQQRHGLLEDAPLGQRDGQGLVGP
jgi:hypothetical protein